MFGYIGSRLGPGARWLRGRLPQTRRCRRAWSPACTRHARLGRIDKAPALATPGVVAVLTAEDMPNIRGLRGRLLLARDRLLFAGQPVALVLATSEAAAEDGAQNFVFESEPLPAVTTIDEALAEGAPLSGRRACRPATPTTPARTAPTSGQRQTGAGDAQQHLRRHHRIHARRCGSGLGGSADGWW